MKNIKKYIGLCGVALLPAALQAQTISFETQDFKSLGVYDTWVQSPFRTGELSGNVAVVDNHLKDADTNSSDKILGVQRSRFGSNTFGVKIDLNETFELTPTIKYCHVMIHKPTSGRVMLIGLGKRADRAEQSNDVEQFWVYPSSDVKADEWFDAVFPIKGNGGIDIYSLVVVPECEPSHTLSSDFVAYVDDIVINDSNTPRVGLGDYPVNFAVNSEWGRDDRKVNGVNFNGGSDGNQSIAITDKDRKGYMVMFDTPFKAKAGNTITPSFDYSGSWVHGFIYLDKDRDGQFSYGVNASGYLDSSTDLVSFSAYRNGASSGNFKNSAGSSFSNGNVLNPPSFTIPSDLAPGIYRMRYKVDWDCIDPAGNIDAANNILANGGGCIDVLLNIHEDQVSVSQDNRNGEVLVASTGNTINNDRIPFGQDFTIRLNPSNGFEYNGIRVRHGYNLTGDSIVKSNPQYRDTIFAADLFDENDTFTIPGSVVDGDLLIEGLFVEQGQGKHRVTVTYNIECNGKVIETTQHSVFPGAQYPVPEITTEASESYYSLEGYPEGTVPEEDTEVTLTLVQNLPFQPCVAIDDETVWYTMTLSGDLNTLSYNPSLSYIDATSTAKTTDEAAQWAFVGDVVNGFKIVNRAAGEGKILSSSTAITSTNDGTVYPMLLDEPVAEGYNTLWIPTVSTSISGKTGFFLHQKGFATNRVNKRDGRLAYWVGGAGAGSTIIVQAFDPDFIDYCEPQPISGRSVSGTVTNRTDRYVTNISVGDGTSTVTVAGGGTSSGRQVFTDRTSTILNTEPGKTISMSVSGKGDWCNTYVFVDTDLNGFDSGDKVYGNWDTKAACNHVVTDLTFTLPADLTTGSYRARYICNWSDVEDPCVYGDAGSDNGEAVIDFMINVTSYGTVTYIVNGEGEIEGWSKIDNTTGVPAANATRINDGDQIVTGAKTRMGVIVIPGVDGEGKSHPITALVVNNGDNAYSQETDADMFKNVVVESENDEYAGATFVVITPLAGDVIVSATFSDDVQSIYDIFGDDTDAPAEFFNINGVKVPAENLIPGVYIMRRGDKTAKIYVK